MTYFMPEEGYRILLDLPRSNTALPLRAIVTQDYRTDGKCPRHLIFVHNDVVLGSIYIPKDKMP